MGDHRLEIVLAAQDQASAVIRGLQKNFESSVKNIMSSIAGISGGIGAGYLVKEAIAVADAWKLAEGRMALVTKTVKDAEAAQQQLFSISQQTRTAYGESVDLYARIARSLKDTNYHQKDFLDVTKLVNQTLKISGSSTEAANAAVIQLGQGFASGAIMGEELRSVLEQAPRLAQAMADGMGKSVGELRALGSEGKLTTDVITKALLSQKDAVATEYARMTSTVGQAMTVLHNGINKAVSDFDKAHGITNSLATGIISLSDNLESVGKSAIIVGGAALPFVLSQIGSGALVAAAGIRTLTLAMVANPIGLFAVALSAGAAAMYAFRSETDKLKDTQSIAGFTAKISVLQKELDKMSKRRGTWAWNSTMESVFKGLQKEIQTTEQRVKDLTDAEEISSAMTQTWEASHRNATAGIKDSREELDKYIEKLQEAAKTAGMAARQKALYDVVKNSAHTPNDIAAVNAAFDIIDAEKKRGEAIQKNLQLETQRQSEISKIIDQYKKEYETVGKTSRQMAEYTLSANKATKAQKDLALSWFDKAEAMKTSIQSVDSALQSYFGAIDKSVAKQLELRESWVNTANILTNLELSKNQSDWEGINQDIIDASIERVEAFKTELESLYDTMDAGAFKGQSFGDSMAEGINNAVLSMRELGQVYESVNAAQELKNKLASGESFSDDPKKDIEERQNALEKLTKFEATSTQNQLSAYRQMFGATAQLFKENSKERKAMSAIEQALAAVEIAINMKKALVSAVGSVTAQGQTPIAGFAMAASMIALMAGVLSQAGISFSGGGGGSAPAATPTVTSYSGTVLGDITASSESIANVTDTLMEIHADEYPELQRIRQEMVELNNNITGLVSSIVQNGGTFDAESMATVSGMGGLWIDYMDNVFEAMFNTQNEIVNASNKFLLGLPALAVKYIGSAIFGGEVSTRKLEEGYRVGDVSVGSLSAGGSVDVDQYAKWRVRQDGGFFGSDKVSEKTLTEEVNEDIQRLMTNVFAGMSESLNSLGVSLGYDAAKIEQYIFKIGDIDLMGLDGEEISKKLSDTFSTAVDVAVGSLFEEIKGYQEVGEGLYETAARLVIDKEIILGSLAAIGMGFKGAANSMAAVDFSQSLLGFSEDLDTLTANISTYFTAFFSEQEQFDWSAGQLEQSLGNINLSLPETRAGFKAMVGALDLTTDAGKRTFVSLMGLSDTADDFYKSSEKTAEAMRKIEDSFKSITISIDDAIAKKTMDDYAYQVKAINDSFADSMREAADQFGIGSEKFNELSVKYATLRDLELEALATKRSEDEIALATATAKTIGDLTKSIGDGIASFGVDEWTQQTNTAAQTVADWQTQIATLVSAGSLLPEMATTLLDQTQEWLRLTLDGIDAAKTAQERKNALDYQSFQYALQNTTGNDATIANMATKRGWGTSYGDIGAFDMERLYKEQVLPFIDMSFDDFKASAEMMGMTWEDLSADTSALSGIFIDLADSAKSAADTFAGISGSIRDQIYGMQTSPDNQRDVMERLGLQKTAIADYTGGQSVESYIASLGSDAARADAISRLQSMYADTLSLYQEAYQRPSIGYQEGYSEVIGSLNSLLDISEDLQSDYDLQYAQTDYLSQIAANTAHIKDIPASADAGGPPAPGTLNVVVHATGGASEVISTSALSQIKDIFLGWLHNDNQVRSGVQRASVGK